MSSQNIKSVDANLANIKKNLLKMIKLSTVSSPVETFSRNENKYIYDISNIDGIPSDELKRDIIIQSQNATLLSHEFVGDLEQLLKHVLALKVKAIALDSSRHEYTSRNMQETFEKQTNENDNIIEQALLALTIASSDIQNHLSHSVENIL